MPNQSKLYRPLIEVAAAEYGLDANLVEAVVRKESSGLTHAYRYEAGFFDRYLADDPAYAGGNPRRVSASYGLMQIMYPTACERGFGKEPEYLFVPSIGLEWGCRQLKYLIAYVAGDIDRALAAYNGGLGSSRRPFRPIISAYVEAVKRHLADIVKGI